MRYASGDVYGRKQRQTYVVISLKNEATVWHWRRGFVCRRLDGSHVGTERNELGISNPVTRPSMNAKHYTSKTSYAFARVVVMGLWHVLPNYCPGIEHWI